MVCCSLTLSLRKVWRYPEHHALYSCLLDTTAQLSFSGQWFFFKCQFVLFHPYNYFKACFFGNTLLRWLDQAMTSLLLSCALVQLACSLTFTSLNSGTQRQSPVRYKHVISAVLYMCLCVRERVCVRAYIQRIPLTQFPLLFSRSCLSSAAPYCHGILNCNGGRGSAAAGECRPYVEI